jgi:alpha-galactosidase
VEIPVIASARGLQGIKQNPLPRRIMDNVLYPRMRTMNNLHEAYLNGDRSSLVLELTHDNRTRSYEQAKTLIDELLRQPWNEEAERHYR